MQTFSTFEEMKDSLNKKVIRKFNSRKERKSNGKTRILNVKGGLKMFRE